MHNNKGQETQRFPALVAFSTEGVYSIASSRYTSITSVQ